MEDPSSRVSIGGWENYIFYIFPKFSSICLCLSKADIDNSFNSSLTILLILLTADEGSSLQAHKFPLYISGSCIPTNEILVWIYLITL